MISLNNFTVAKAIPQGKLVLTDIQKGMLDITKKRLDRRKIFNVEKHLQRRPRNLSDMPLVGIFSQRAKNRPNAIGITAVKIIGVNEEGLVVEGLDGIKGTPVLDIKPYYPVYDIVQNAKVPKWVDRLMTNYF